MKVGRIDPTGRLALDELPLPRAGPGELVVSLAACGVCGTDLEKLRGNYRTAGKIGHEPVGRVREVGAGVAEFAPGDAVFVHHHIPCYACAVCAAGDLTFCPSYSKTNLEPGGFAEAFQVSREHVGRKAVLRLDRRISWESGALFEPTGCALTALRRVGWRPGSTIVVLGLGPVGLAYLRVARALGARWSGAADLSARRRGFAAETSADAVADAGDPASVRQMVERATGGSGADLAVVAAGAPVAVTLATELVRRGGTVNLFGLPAPESHLEPDLQSLYLRGVRVIPSYATTETDIAEVQSLVLSGSLRLEDLVSHRVPLERIAEAISVAADPEVSLKVLVTGPAFAGRDP